MRQADPEGPGLPEFMERRLMERWARLGTGPAGLGRRLLDCWMQPYRAYHGIGHLTAALDALAVLGGERLESVAVWFHDAVWTLPSDPDHARDERRSADLAREWLAGALPGQDVDEVARLVMVTISHSPAPGDDAGARVSDADLVLLAADWDHYLRSVAGLRVESRLAGPAWAAARRPQIDELLGRRRIYSLVGSWEDAARTNLARERELLG